MPSHARESQSERVALPPAISASAEWLASAEWVVHEHNAELTHSHAQPLLESAGSPELAKHALEIAAVDRAKDSADATASASEDRAISASASQAKLAALLGYASYLDLFEASKSIRSDGNLHWLITADSNGKWTLWNDSDFEMVERFDTRDAAANAALSPAERKPG